MNKCRDAFEKYANIMSFALAHDGMGGYWNDRTDDAWIVWKAATESRQQEIDQLNERNHELVKKIQDRHEAVADQQKVIDQLVSAMKAALNQLEHIVPTIDPQMDGSEDEKLAKAIIYRVNYPKAVLAEALAKHREARDAD